MKQFQLLLINLLTLLTLVFVAEFISFLLVPDNIFPITDSNFFVDSVYYSSPGLKPNQCGTSYGIEKKVNSDGSWDLSKSKGKKDTVLWIGDSVLMGLGVKNDSTYSGLLNSDSSININTGLIGYSIDDYYNVIMSFSNSDIKKVVVNWCLNDLYSNYPTKDAPGKKLWIISFIQKFLRENSYAYHLIKNLFTDRPKVYFEYDQQFYSETNPLFQNANNKIKVLKELCKIKNIELVFVLLPYEYQLRINDNIEINKPQKMISKILDSLDIKYLDCSEAFNLTEGDSKEWYLYNDGIHFSKKGHNKIAAFINKNLF